MITIEELTVEVARQRDALKRIEALIWYEPEDYDDLVEAVRVMACERNEAIKQARHAWDRAAEKDKAYGEALRERDEQIAEAASWRATARDKGSSSRAAAKERDELRAEVERLRGDLARCREAQRATAEGWRHEVAEIAAIVGAPAHTAELAAYVRAEVERLRGALAQPQRADE